MSDATTRRRRGGRKAVAGSRGSAEGGFPAPRAAGTVGGAGPGRAAVEAWFASRGWEPFDFQRSVWDAYAGGRSGLLHAPTGMGKTWAVWGGPLATWMDAHGVPSAPGAGPRPGEVGDAGGTAAERRRRAAPISVLWLTPLRALAGDTARSLAEPVRDLGLPWTIETRTGDTPAALKQKQRDRLPTALVTTPESLSLLLSYPGAAERFATLECLVADEWHELMGSKRGVQAELCIARLRTLRPQLRTWGVSATLGNLDEARAVLLGPRHAEAAALVEGRHPKAVEVETLRPDDLERFPWAGHLGLRMLDGVLARIEAARSTLVFTNTRSQAELWFQAILRARPEWLGRIAIHHGSVDRGARGDVERMLREGELSCVVCTSSLDLGVDFSPVDQVIQVGSPKGVARLLQRAGRSGHAPGRVSRIVGVPTNAVELIEFAAARDAVAAGRVEARRPAGQSMDVLVQHLVTIALGDGFTADPMLEEVRSTHAFAELTDDAWRWALDFVVQGGACLQAYPQYRKVDVDEAGMHRVSQPLVGRLHRMSIGTITSDGALQVKVRGGRTLGTIEESFVTRLRPGDRFVFAGRVLELIRIREMTAEVKAATRRRGSVPRWNGGRSPLSTQLAEMVRAKLQGARDGIFADAEMACVRPILELQARWSIIPAADELLVERTSYRGAFHAFCFTFAGRLANEGLSALVAHRITRRLPCSISVTANDHGIELMADEPFPAEEDDWRGYLTPDGLVDDLLGALDASQLARRHFREIARVAGLVIQGFPGRARPARQLQASSELFYDVFSDFDPDNRLLRQAKDEVLERELDVRRMRGVLKRIAGERLRIVDTERFSPLAFPLYAERIRGQQLSSEDWVQRVQKMVVQLESAADRGGGTR